MSAAEGSKAAKKHAQSAIEYLTTYGWAILLIMVVLVAFFYFGVFSGKSFQPRVPPGECSVYRPGGMGSIEEIDITGICTGELPEYVDRFSYGSTFSEIGTSNITVPEVKYMPEVKYNWNGVTEGKVTVTGWFLSYPPGPVQTAVYYGYVAANQIGPPYNGIYFNINDPSSCSGGFYVTLYEDGAICMTYGVPPRNTWAFGVAEWNGTHLVGYTVINSNVVSANTIGNSFDLPAHSSMYISTPWNGLISNVQIYNNSLTRNQVMQLYAEGLGGAPIDLKYLAGWWPLNGNINDYSGNGNTGYPYNSAGISGSYDNNYTPP